MDSIVHTALEQICSHGTTGITLPNLWPNLQSPLPLCPNVKKALWLNLINIPALQFESRGVFYSAEDEAIKEVDKCEMMDLKIVAAEQLRNSFVGIYDIKASDAGVSMPQRRVLERLAIARTNGITQSELAKELCIKGNNIFYVLKNLESRGLIVRQSTILRKKEASNEGEPKNSSIVNTNMLYLYRYAKHLGCQQRLEITKEDKTLVGNDNEDGSAASSAGVADQCVKEDVHVKDYLPALKAICDKLEKAAGKVLVISDIKRHLGYRGTSGHRAWRNICHRLKDARVVEEFCAKVNKKEVSCLRLLKKFSPKNFEPKTLGCGDDDLDSEQPMKLGKRGQINDQLVELPIEHQIYDMIDAEGSKGLTITEVCKRLGISNKRYYTRLLNMFSRFGMHLQAESHNRGVAYRVWTFGNFNSEASNINKQENVFNESGACNPRVGNLDIQEKSAPTVQEVEHSTSQSDARAAGENENLAIESELSHGLPSEGECNNMLLCPSSSENVVDEPSGIVSHEKLQIVSKPTESNIASLEASPSVSSTPRRRRSYQRYPCLTLNAASTQREQRILEVLQGEKFIIKAELHRHLESLEKDKHTMMDRKTLERSLNKLQQEGHCKCIRVSVPVVTNCGRSRTMDVVLHPSVLNVSPELLGQIHERLRSFDMEIRGQGSSRLKKDQSVPVLSGVQRILKNGKLDSQTERSEAMRANGYVLAKMVRTKLLHIFLWGYLSGLPGWDDALLSGKHGYDLKNPHSTCKPFELEAAIKAMPLERFLQVVGSAKKNEDMIDKCRIGLRLSDLPEQEYKNLMDTQATARLSLLIDILRRLKLMRMVSGERSEDVDQVLNGTLTHALELKPYIEEPVAMVVPPSGLISLDIRPQVRHDFVLSRGKAVDEYWNTLEYCYAAADSKAALHAFPGSAVHEVFLFRSWASARVMTADQRAELLKRIGKDDLNKKLSYKECEKIAKDLHLTLEQVLRIYYDKRQKRRTRLRGVPNNQGEDFRSLRNYNVSSPRKRKRSSEGRSLKHAKVDNLDGELSEQRHDILSITDDQFTEEQDFFITSSGDDDNNSLKDHVDDHMETIEEPGSNEEDEESHSFIRKCALSRLSSTRRRRFSWTEMADRQLVIEYVRHRAALGADFHRADWASLPNLPAPPVTCKRRMALLNSSIQFRKAVMRLCNILSERYAKHLSKFQIRSLDNDDSRVMVRHNSYGEDCNRNLSNSLEHIEAYDSEERWDDFNDENLKIALDEVLRYKRMAKLASVSEEHSYLNMDSEGQEYEGTKLDSSAIPSEDVQNYSGRSRVSARRTRFHRLPRKYIKLLNEEIGVSRRAYGSLAVSNAAELFKLVFLSSSTAPQVPNLLAETLRRYSEHDLFAAFDYLREKKIMVGGNGSSPFVLSQQFLQRISSSPFPSNTGKRAAKFASWLREREKDLIEEGVDLTADLQCGDVLHLFALVSSGELLISPCLPDQGVGEAEDSRTSKRKSDNYEFESGDKSKKPKPLLAGEGEIISRREKGFPGIKLSLSCATISRIDAVEIFKNLDICSAPFPIRGSDEVNLTLTQNVDSNSSPSNSHMMEILNSRATIPTTGAANESPWEAMTCYAKNLVSVPCNQEQGSLLSPELFKIVYSAIQMAGDQGLRIEEIRKVMNAPGEKMPELIVEVLETFGHALKVNGYDSIHVVDSLYRSKYFLTSMAGYYQDHKVDHQSANSKGVIDDNRLILQQNHHEYDGGNVQKEISSNVDEVHRVIILNLPEEVPQPSSEMQKTNEIEGDMQAKIVSSGRDREGEVSEFSFGDSNLCSPILPWINGDGTVNEIVYKGLIRRVLGIVMQNPGILEDDILMQMRILNPQSCKTLLELMILDNHIIVRKMNQATSVEPPALLGRLFGSSFEKSKLICRKHFFANPLSTSFL